MKRCIVLIILILASFQVSAFDKIFDDHIYTLDTFEVDGDLFYVTLANGNDVLVVRKNQNEVFTIEDDSCEDTAFYKYCYNGTSLNYVDYGRPIPNTLDWEPAIHFQIYSKTPTVTVSRVIDDSTINVNDKSRIRVLIVNSGQLDIINLDFAEILPENAEVFSLGSGLQRYGNKIYWTSSRLKAGQTVELFYSLSPESYEEIVLNNATLMFEYEGEEFKKDAGSNTISINMPYTFSWSITNSELGVDEKSIFKFNVKNNDWNDNLKVSFNFEADKGLKLLEVPFELDGSDNIYYETFTLRPDESKDFSIELMSNWEGKYVIKSDATMNIRDEVYHETKEYNLSVTLPDLIYDLSSTKSSVLEGNPYTITLSIENPANIPFIEVVANVQSSLFEDKSLTWGIITPGDKVTLLEEVFRAPNVKNNTKYNIRLNGLYKTVNNANPVAGEEIQISVGVENIGEKPGTVTLEELIPEDFELVAGLTNRVLQLSVGQELNFYTYRLKIPLEIMPGVYTIKTLLKHETGDNYRYLNITVNSPEMEQEVAVDLGLGNSATQNTSKKESKGFFSTIVNFFKDLFS